MLIRLREELERQKGTEFAMRSKAGRIRQLFNLIEEANRLGSSQEMIVKELNRYDFNIDVDGLRTALSRTRKSQGNRSIAPLHSKETTESSPQANHRKEISSQQPIDSNATLIDAFEKASTVGKTNFKNYSKK